MKHLNRRTALTAALAGALLAGAAAPAAALEPPAPGQWITPAPSINTEAMKHGEVISGHVYLSPIGVPFAKTTDGKVVVGDGTDTAHTQTWIPWTDRIEYLAPKSSTVSLLSHRGPNAVNGGIATKFLDTGGEAKWGRSTSPETTKMNGRHAGATPVQVQTFRNAEIHWTKARGAHPVGGSILKKWRDLTGLNGLGAAVTDEYNATVKGKPGKAQQFQRGTLYWSPATGSFRG